MSKQIKKKIPIKIEKINSSTLQLTKISSVVLDKIISKFSYLPSGYKFQPKFRLMGIKGVRISLVQRDGTFPAGLFTDIVTFITEELKKKVVMSNDVLEHFLPLTDIMQSEISDDVFSEYEIKGRPVVLRDYQLGAVKAAFENRHGLLNLSTGAGKCLGGNTKINVKLDENIIKKYEYLIKKDNKK